VNGALDKPNGDATGGNQVGKAEFLLEGLEVPLLLLVVVHDGRAVHLAELLNLFLELSLDRSCFLRKLQILFVASDHNRYVFR
jgi:hypothetical protein